MHDIVQASVQYTDTEYNSEVHDKYRLSIQLRLDGFSFAIIDPERKQLMQLQDFKIMKKSGQSVRDRWDHLQGYFLQFLNQQEFHSATFQKTIISIDHKEYTLMPASLFSKGNENEQLLFNQSISYPFVSFSNTIPGTERKLISAIYKPLNIVLQDYFESASLQHSITVLQNEIYKAHKNKKLGQALYVYVSNHDMHLTAVDGEKLLMSNSFTFTSKEDFVYFILLAYDQLKINPEQDPIYFLGEISKSSPIYQICWQYIRHIHFISQTTGVFAGSSFDQMPIHQYYILIQSALCE